MKKFSIIAAAALTLAGCSQKENISQDADLSIVINPEITKVTGTRFDNLDKIGLDIKQDGEDANYLTNAELIYNGVAFTASNLIWYKGKGTSALTAYYPYSAEGRPSAWEVATDQTKGYAAYDILGAVKTGATPSETAISMTFHHLLSKIIVEIDNQATERSLSVLTLKGLIPGGNLDFATCTSSASGTAADFTPYKNGEVYELLVPAQTATVTYSATLSDAATLEKTANSLELKSGKSHKMTVTITDKDLKVTISGDIEDWTIEDDFIFE